MKRALLAGIALVALLAFGLLAMAGVWLFASYLTQSRVLEIIESSQPGTNITKVIEKYGSPTFETDDPLRMGRGSAPMPPEFIKGKKLHQYYVTPPCRMVNIYTDGSGAIVYVNWSAP